jgi:hypothetical protein
VFFVIAGIDVGSLFKQQLGYERMSVGCGIVQSRFAFAAAGGHIGTAL